MVTMIMHAHFELQKTAEMNQSVIIFPFLALMNPPFFMCSLKDLTEQFALDLHTQQFLQNEIFASHLCR